MFIWSSHFCSRSISAQQNRMTDFERKSRSLPSSPTGRASDQCIDCLIPDSERQPDDPQPFSPSSGASASESENEPPSALHASSPSLCSGHEIHAEVSCEEERAIASFKYFLDLKREQRTRDADSLEGSPAISIRRVPDRLLRGKNQVYEPKVISIGPYHRGKPRLQFMEIKKQKHLEDILPTDPESFPKIFRELNSLEERVRRCYSHAVDLDKNSFLHMMLLDSCYIVHLLLQSIENSGRPLIGPVMFYDLLLLENQLPFFLVLRMFDLVKQGKWEDSLVNLVLESHCRIQNKNSQDKKILLDRMLPDKECHHLLHLYHWFNVCHMMRRSAQKPESISSNLRPVRGRIKPWGFSGFYHNLLSKSSSPSAPKPKSMRFNLKSVLERSKGGRFSGFYHKLSSKTPDMDGGESGVMIPTATLLHEAGIEIRRKEEGGSILDVSFCNGILKLPPLLIHDGSVCLFQNLIAFEQCNEFYFHFFPQFTAYFNFMDHLINTAGDVALLQRSGIIEHSWGSEKGLAKLFNQLTRGATINPNNYLSRLYRDVNLHCKKKTNIWGAMFLRRHCSNPLTILSSIGFLILLAFAFVQSFFAVLAYFKPSS